MSPVPSSPTDGASTTPAEPFPSSCSNRRPKQRSAPQPTEPEMRLRTRAEITRFFEGLELLDPGVVTFLRWHTERRIDRGARCFGSSCADGMARSLGCTRSRVRGPWMGQGVLGRRLGVALRRQRWQLAGPAPSR
ncbi:MAG: SAM-dependent methyltransferase [Actinomadura sp.]